MSNNAPPPIQPRTYFAGLAMQSFLDKMPIDEIDAAQVAEMAYKIAAAMMEEGRKPIPPRAGEGPSIS